MSLRPLRTAMLALALVTVVILVPAQPAQAQTVHLACAGNFQINFDPPLTLVPSPQDFELLGQAGIVNCVPLSSEAEGLASATVSDAVGTGTATTCVLITSTGTGELEWNTGQISEFAFEINLNLLNPEVSPGFSAQLTSGPLTGSTITAVPVVSLSGTCVTGVTSMQALFAAFAFVE